MIRKIERSFLYGTIVALLELLTLGLGVFLGVYFGGDYKISVKKRKNKIEKVIKKIDREMEA